MGSAAVAVYQLTFFWAVVDTGVAVSTLAAIGVSPLASRLIGASMHRPPPSSIWFLSALLLIGGLTGLVVGGYDGLVVRPLGVVSAVVAGTAFAGYTEVTAVSIGRGAHPDAALGSMFAMAGVMTVPVLFFRPIDVLQSWSGLLVVSHLSLVTLTVAYMAFGRGLRQLPPTSATMLTMAEPLVATVLAVLIVGERLSAIGWIGAFLLLGGLIAVARSTRYQAATVLS